MCLQDLYELGARKFSLIGLNLIGCIPYEISTHGKNDSMCVQEESQAAQLFNEELKALVDRYNKELVGAKFIYVNSAFMKYSNFKLPGIYIYLNIFNHNYYHHNHDQPII